MRWAGVRAGREHINQSIDRSIRAIRGGRDVRCECTIYSWVGIVDPKHARTELDRRLIDSDCWYVGSLYYIIWATTLTPCMVWVWILFGKQAPRSRIDHSRSTCHSNRPIDRSPIPFASGGNRLRVCVKPGRGVSNQRALDSSEPLASTSFGDEA